MPHLSRYEIVPDDELAAALAAILRRAAGPLDREARCFLATVSAAYVADRLSSCGFVVMRPDAACQTTLEL